VETKIILVIVALCLSVISMILSTVFLIGNLRDIKKIDESIERLKLSKKRYDSHDNSCDGNAKR